MVRIKNYLRSIKNLSIDIGGTDDAIIVAGSARSGTTWIGDVIADATQSRIIFEPFLVDKESNFSLVINEERSVSDIIYAKSLNITNDSTIDTQLKNQIHRILSGKIYSTWTEQQVKKGLYSRRLIKDIRLSLMLGYITKQWPLIPIVYILRNPFDVLLSQINKNKSGWEFGWNKNLFRVLELHNDPRFSDVYDRIKESDSFVISSMNRWFIENTAAIHDLNYSKNAMIVNYDKLKSNGNAAWDELKLFFESRNIPFDMRKVNLEQPSFTSNMSGRDKNAYTLDDIDESDISYFKQLVRGSVLSDYIMM